MSKLNVILLILAIMVCFVIPAQASPIQFGTNYYDLITPDTGAGPDWFSAKTFANSSTYLGFSGHLVTITSKAENDFLFNNFGTGNDAFEGAWIGGKYPEGWLDGPENGQTFSSYANFAGAEPNNRGYAYMLIGNYGPNNMVGGQWADDSGKQGFPGTGDPVTSFFIEYEGDSGSPAVPEPASIFLFGLGSLGTFLKKRFV